MTNPELQLPVDPMHWETWLLGQFDRVHSTARDALSRHDWSALAEVTSVLDQLAGQLNLAISQGFSSIAVEQRLLEAIDFIEKSRQQASHQAVVMRQKEVDLLAERQKVVLPGINKS